MFETKFNKFADRVVNIVLLGFISVLFSLPIFTIGASMTALNSAMSQYLFEDNHKTIKAFINSFKEHFVLSTKVWLAYLLLIVILVWDIFYYRTGYKTLDILGATICFTLLAIICMQLCIVFVLISNKMIDSFVDTFKLATNIVFKCFIRMFLITVICLGIPFAIYYLFPSFLIFLPGLISYLCWQLIPDLLNKYKFS